jgi:hypothetical protein
MKGFSMKAAAAAVVVATASLLSIGQTVAVAQDKAPDATFRYSGGAVGVGVGGSWGQGTLHFQGKDYPFRMRGLDLVNVGASKVTASGDVYNLKNLADFSGTYAAASAGLALAGGGSGTAMKNDRGVVIRMTSTAKGVQVKFAVEGVAIELEKQPD